MVKGKPISEELQWTVICLGTAMTLQEVAMYTDLGHPKNSGYFPENRYDEHSKAYIVNATGNPWVFLAVPVPVPITICTLTQEYGFCQGYILSAPRVTR